MTEAELNRLYFEWMYHIVYDGKGLKNLSYWRLFEYLHSREFVYTIPMDGNRAEDGIDLRYRFGRDEGYSEAMIASMLDVRPCSVLEMMVALSIRCENAIMWNPDIGDRTSQWFWEMIVNLGLGHMDDEYFDIRIADRAVDDLLKHRYKRNGEGGLFKIRDRSKDMRNTEIWYQMNWYMDEVLKGK